MLPSFRYQRQGGLGQSRKASGRGQPKSWAWKNGYIFGDRERERSGKGGSAREAEVQQNMQHWAEFAYRTHVFVGNDGDVYAKHRVQTCWVCGQDSKGGGLCRPEDTHTATARLRDILKAKQEHLDKVSWVLGGLCMS